MEVPLSQYLVTDFFFVWIFQNQSAAGNVIQLMKNQKP